MPPALSASARRTISPSTLLIALAQIDRTSLCARLAAREVVFTARAEMNEDRCVAGGRIVEPTGPPPGRNG